MDSEDEESLHQFAERWMTRLNSGIAPKIYFTKHLPKLERNHLEKDNWKWMILNKNDKQGILLFVTNLCLFIGEDVELVHTFQSHLRSNLLNGTMLRASKGVCNTYYVYDTIAMEGFYAGDEIPHTRRRLLFKNMRIINRELGGVASVLPLPVSSLIQNIRKHYTDDSILVLENNTQRFVMADSCEVVLYIDIDTETSFCESEDELLELDVFVETLPNTSGVYVCEMKNIGTQLYVNPVKPIDNDDSCNIYSMEDVQKAATNLPLLTIDEICDAIM